MKCLISFPLFICNLWLASAFQAPSLWSTKIQRCADSVQLWGRKRGNLGKSVSLDENDQSKASKKRALTKNRKKSVGGGPTKEKKSKTAASAVSPALAQWAVAGASDTVTTKDETKTSRTTTSSSSTNESTPAFVPFAKEDDEEEGDDDDDDDDGGNKKKLSARRARKKERNALETTRIAEMKQFVDDVETVLSEKKLDLEDLLAKLRSLLTRSRKSGVRIGLKTLLKSSKKRSYRMAWVGSDEAICHVGTGLHKVPLARLQEVFLTLGGNRVEVMEVIRIIGPFLNVRNTLQGQSKVTNGEESVRWNISYDSMIDGTGKELLAGKDNDVRIFELDVLFATEELVLAIVPTEDAKRSANPFGVNGANVLLFLREEDLSSQLQKLRVD